MVEHVLDGVVYPLKAEALHHIEIPARPDSAACDLCVEITFDHLRQSAVGEDHAVDVVIALALPVESFTPG